MKQLVEISNINSQSFRKMLKPADLNIEDRKDGAFDRDLNPHLIFQMNQNTK